jgi:thymidylate synthase ThyX
MKVTNVSILPTESAKAAGRPTLTPELLAACGARYSRNNEGLGAILSKIDPNNLDKSVDGIFKMIDYGHQSIADMVPVSMFIDDLSIFLAYLIWSWCPTAGGQESSTRYIKLDRTGLVDPSLFGLPENQHKEWYRFMDDCFDAYGSALEMWERVGTENPELTCISNSLLDDSSDKARKQVARMKRNYAFDRSRYFLPVAAKTNMMLVMSSRGWIQLCQNLLSHWLPEAKLLGENIRGELELTAPRMVKHAERKASFVAGHQSELDSIVKAAIANDMPLGEAPCRSNIELYLPMGVSEADLVESLQDHDNRYANVGMAGCRTSVRFAWTAVAIAEIRDLNRHRTGQKYCPLIPQGFYCANDQLPAGTQPDKQFALLGDYSTNACRSSLAQGIPGYPAWILLGSQFRFEHATMLDKFIYEAELRTGTGAHYRYASHFRNLVVSLGEQYPKFAAALTLGSSEPE